MCELTSYLTRQNLTKSRFHNLKCTNSFHFDLKGQDLPKLLFKIDLHNTGGLVIMHLREDHSKTLQYINYNRTRT